MTACPEWKDRLLDSALNAPVSSEVEEHLRTCAVCSAALGEFRVRHEQLEAGLRKLVQGVEPSPAFRAGLLACLEARPARVSGWPVRVGALAAVVAIVVAGFFLAPWNKKQARRTEPGAVSVSNSTLSRWRAPTDGLLRSSSEELLKRSPRLGEFYFPVNPASVREDAEKKKWRKL